MKKLVVVLICCFLLVACQAPPSDKSLVVVNNDKLLSETNSDLLNEFMIVADSEAPYKILQYIRDNIPRASSLEADIMIVTLMDRQADYLDTYRERALEEEYQASLKLLYDQRKFESSTFKEGSFVYELQQGGYRIIESSLGYMPIPDYSKLKFEGFTTTAFVDYIEIASLEATIPYIVDNRMNISWDELAKRTYACEAYIKKHPKSMSEKKVKELYKNYMNGLTRNVGESFVYDSSTPKLLFDVRQAYLNYIYFYPDYETTEILDKYLKLYESTGRITSEVLLQVENMINESKLLKNLTNENQGN